MKIVLNKNDPKTDVIYAAVKQAFFKDRHCVVNFSGVEIELDMDSLTTSQTSTNITIKFGDFRPLCVADVVESESDAELEARLEYDIRDLIEGISNDPELADILGRVLTRLGVK